jgi:hypothetical protein
MTGSSVRVGEVPETVAGQSEGGAATLPRYPVTQDSRPSRASSSVQYRLRNDGFLT